MSRSDVVRVAAGQLGVVEGTYTFPDGRTVTGPNVVRYWPDLGVLQAFTPAALRSGGWAWCAAFVTWCLLRAVGVDLRRLMWPYSCDVIRSWAIANGRWRTTGYTPQPGDLQLYDFGAGLAHIGIYETRFGANYVAIEGNTSPGNSGSQANGGSVYRRARGRRYIAGWVDMTGLVDTAPAPTPHPDAVPLPPALKGLSMSWRVLQVSPGVDTDTTDDGLVAVTDSGITTLRDNEEVTCWQRIASAPAGDMVLSREVEVVRGILARIRQGVI